MLYASTMKRLLDILVSASALLALSPVLAVIALLVRWKLGSPVLFRQVRPGITARPFEMVKFRTMTDGRDAEGRLLSDAERLTPFGRFLRSSSLDELPELWNVLKGEMSLVGPRPLLRKYLPYYSRRERRRHEARPGITGWSQINGRNTTPWDRRLELDVWYVENRNLWLDLKIILATIGKILKRSGLIDDPRSAMKDLHVEREHILEIRAPTSDEIEAAGCLIRETYDPALVAHTIIASPGFPRFLRDVQGRSDVIMGLFRSGELAGVFQAREIDGKLHLNNFAIRADEQGWGCADILLDAFHSIAAGRRTELFVDSRNPVAARLYARHGYREAGVLNFKTVELDSERKIDRPVEASVVDPEKADLYGFSYLEIDGLDEKFGFILPDHIIAPEGLSDEIISMIEDVSFVSKITLSGNSLSSKPMGRDLSSWRRITLIHDSSNSRQD